MVVGENIESFGGRYMNTTIINVKEVIGSPSALTREQGQLLLEEIRGVFAAGDKVIVDFAEIESMIIPFLNIAIGKLYEDNTSDLLKENFKFQSIPKWKAVSFNLVIENVKRYYANQGKFA